MEAWVRHAQLLHKTMHLTGAGATVARVKLYTCTPGKRPIQQPHAHTCARAVSFATKHDRILLSRL
jgi:hypothetical protein